MSEIKLEVGQVWKHKRAGDHCKIIHTSDAFGYYIFKDDYKPDYMEKGSFCEMFTLVTNADGTPHVKPNDYRNGDIWQSLITSALYSFWNGTYRDVFDVSGDYFRYHKSSPLITEPHEYKLIYRDGQGVIND